MFGSNDKAMQIGGLQIGGLCPVIKLLMMSMTKHEVDNNIQGVYQQSSEVTRKRVCYKKGYLI